MFFCQANNHAFLKPCEGIDAQCYRHWARYWVGPKVPAGNWKPAFKAVAILLLTELSWTCQCHVLLSCLDSQKSLVIMYHVYKHRCGANPVVTVSCFLVLYTWILTSIVTVLRDWWPLECSLQLEEWVPCFRAIATYCLPVELPMSSSEEGGSQLVPSNENFYMLCCICVHIWVQSKGTHDCDADQMWRLCGASDAVPKWVLKLNFHFRYFTSGE
jgi:hypothetical protein